LQLDDIKAAHRELFQPDSAALFIAGDVTVDEAKATFDKLFGDWKGSTPAAAKAFGEYPFAVKEGPLVAVVHRPGAVQTVVRFITPGVAFTDSKRMPLRLLSTILGAASPAG
jgi:predicted Zn-dependent peptidase